MDSSKQDLANDRICTECAASSSAMAMSVCPHSPLLTDDPLVGKVIAERYKILSVVGVGGWSTVYAAEDTKLDRRVAIKALHPHLCIEQDKLQRFQREAEAASSLTHANIGVIYDTGLLAALRPFIVMELVEGKSFAEVIFEHRPLSQLIPIFTQVCEGLTAIHKLGLVHRDLKPSNIIVLPSGQAKVLDFGSVKWISQADLTRTDETVGTPSYMSPEQCLGTEIDWRSDIYALGCIMYEAVTGVKAFSSEHTLVCMKKQIQSLPPSFSRVRPDLHAPPALEHLIFRALAKSPGDRFASVEDLQKALQNYDKSPTLLQLASHQIKLYSSAVPYAKGLGWSAAVALSLVAFMSIAPMLAKKRTLNFPAGHDAGVLYLIINPGTPGETRTKYATAEGPVDVPAEAILSLQQVPKKEAAALTVLSKLRAGDLYALDLYGAPVTTSAITQINKLSGLKVLSLNRSDVSDQALSELNIAGLKGLDLADTKVSDQSLASVVENMKQLKWLALTGNTKVTDAGAVKLTRLPAVTALRLGDMPGLTDVTAQALSTAPMLGMLELGSDKISNNALCSLAGAANLRSLDVSGTAITNDGIACLARFKHLTKLNLSQTDVGDGAADALAGMKNLKVLNVSGSKLSNEVVQRLKINLPQCAIEK
jgi:serine/threonine protein kinase